MKHKQELVAKVGITKEKDFLYFVDGDGDISKVKMQHIGKQKK